MRLAEHLTAPFAWCKQCLLGWFRLVLAMPACLVKTRHAPSRHSRDARVYEHITTAMQKLSTLRPPTMAWTLQAQKYRHRLLFHLLSTVFDHSGGNGVIVAFLLLMPPEHVYYINSTYM